MPNPTIVAASLSDNELKASINALVSEVNKATTQMADDFNAQIQRMEDRIKALGSTKTTTSGTSDGGATRRTSSLAKEKQSVDSLQVSYDKLLGALQYAQRALRLEESRDGGVESINKHAALLSRVIKLTEELAAKRKDVAMAIVENRQFTPNVSDIARSIGTRSEAIKQMARFYGEEEKAGIRQMREDLQNALKTPATTIDEIRTKVTKLNELLSQAKGTTIYTPQQVANAEALLNNLQQQLVARERLQQTYDEEIRKMAQLIRESEEYKKTRQFSFSHPFQVGGQSAGTSYINDESRKGALSIEEQLLQIKQHQVAELKYAIEHGQQINWQTGQTIQLVNQQVEAEQRAVIEARQQAQAQAEIARQAQAAAQATQQQSAQAAQQKASTPTYKTLEEEIAEVLKIQAREVHIANTEKASYDSLAASLSQLQAAYNKLNAEQRNGDLGARIADQMQIIQNAMKQIKSQSGRALGLDDALVLPEKTLEEIAYKIQMLRSYAQGVNIETSNGANEVRKVSDEVDKLNQKAKEIQQTTKQIQAEANAKRFEKISAMPDGDYDSLMRKTREMYSLLKELRSQPVLDEKSIKRVEASLIKMGQSLSKLNQTRGTKANVEGALGMSANTLDEIARKMQRLQAIRANLNLDTQRGDIERINKALSDLSKKQDEVLQKSTMQKDANNALARSWSYMKNRLAFYLTVGASMSFLKQLAEIRGQYEMVEKSIGILIQSAERGTQIFSELSHMALVSPYTLVELSTAAKQLVAYDVAAKDVVDTTRRLADMTASVGVPVERLTYALGQIKAYGYLNARDARMFSNTGIPLVKELSNYYTELEGRMVSVSDVYDRIKKKAIGYNDVMSVITKLTDEGGRFFDYQAKMADTLKVRLANLTLAWNNMLNDIGQSSQGFLTWGIGALKNLFLQWKNIETAIYALITAFGVLKATQFTYFAWFAKASQKVGATQAAQIVLGQKLTNVFKGLGASLKALAVNPWTWVFVGIAAIAELSYEAYNASKATAALNNELKKNAGEASKSIGEYVDSKAAKSQLELAQANKLSGTEGRKAWEGLREELEKSSLASSSLMSDLLAIKDINERVAAGFDYADRIRRAQEAMQNLKKGTIEVSKTYLGGFFGEGLLDDLEDYINAQQRAAARAQATEDQRARGDNEAFRFYSEALLDLKNAREEYESEFEVTKKSIKRFLDEERIDDPLQIKEILARAKAQIIAAKPEMSEAAREMLDFSLAEAFLGDTGRNEALMRAFFARLKARSQSVFASIDEDWIHSTEEMSAEMQNAIYGGLENMKKDFPELAKDLAKAFEELDASGRLRVHIAAIVNVRELTDFQRDMQERIKKAGGGLGVDFGPAFLDPKETENIVSYAKRAQDEIKKLEEENNLYAKRADEWARQEIAHNNTIIALWKKRLDLYALPYTDGKGKDVLGDALAKEVQLVGELQKRYKEYKKMGMDANTALQKATDEYRQSLEQTNRTLQGFGVTPIDDQALAQLPLQDIKEAYERQLEVAKRLGNTKGVEALEKAIANLNVEIAKIDYTKIVEGLNNELGKLKEGYELAIELDANPELGSIFADMMGISQDDLAQLPRDAAEVAKMMQEAIRRELHDGGLSSLADSFNIDKLRNVGALEDWFSTNEIEKDSDLYKSIRSLVDYVNKTRLDESKKQIDEWNKLLEKYSEYEYKVAQIQKTAVQERVAFAKKNGTEEQKTQAMQLEAQIAAEKDPQKKQELVEQLQNLVKEIAGGDANKIQIVVAIDTKEAQDVAQLSFEEFQKSPEWITATGDLAGLTHAALGSLITDLEEYKKKAKNLNPKQIKQINKALRDLRKQQRNNPFAFMANLMEEAKARGEEYQIAIDETKKKIDEYNDKRERGEKLNEEEEKSLASLIKRYNALKKKKEEVEKISPKAIADGINGAISAAQQATQMFTEMMDALGGTHATQASKVISGIAENLTAAGTGAAIGAQIGGGYGAIIGAVAGGLMNGIKQLAGAFSGNNKIDKEVNASVLAVKRLTNAYIDLQHAIENSYGVATIGAQQAAIANKKLQLAELQRQLSLEESRKSKYRDKSRILELRGEIKELQYEISDSIKEITNDLLGISSVGDAVDNMVQGVIDALRQGENALDGWNDSIDDMIANMIKKFAMTHIVLPKFEEVFKKIEKRVAERAQPYYDEAEILQERVYELKRWYSPLDPKYEKYVLPTERELEETKKKAEEASKITIDDIKESSQDLAELKKIGPEVEEFLKALYDEMGIKTGGTDNALSALQQGIQGITEDTASALEAYMNGVSQQVYLHSDLLMQINTTIQSWDFDVQTATQAQMLLQLQQSYQVQLAIQSTLMGWSNASGQAVRVEMI